MVDCQTPNGEALVFCGAPGGSILSEMTEKLFPGMLNHKTNKKYFPNIYTLHRLAHIGDEYHSYT